MKFDRAKSYPHPVLRRWSSDYPHAEFQVEVTLDRDRASTAVRVRADFALSDPDLKSLVENGGAQYVLRVRASKTQYRRAFASREPLIEEKIADGNLHGLAEFYPFLVCTRPLSGFRAAGWHDDYAALAVSLESGAVLAEDCPKEYWLDTPEDDKVASIFTCQLDETMVAGRWQCSLEDEKLCLRMAPEDHRRFVEARTRVNGSSEAAYILNAVYFPALVSVLHEADQGSDELADRRWYRSLDRRLADVGCNPLGARAADRLTDAQRLLEQPFPRMPLMAEAREES